MKQYYIVQGGLSGMTHGFNTHNIGIVYIRNLIYRNFLTGIAIPISSIPVIYLFQVNPT